MKLSHGAGFAALFALFVVTGYVAPWWAVALPAFAYGLMFTSGKSWRIHGAIALTAAGAWCLPALIQDAAVGWRISGRIAGVMGLPSTVISGVFAYLLTVCLGALIAILGSSTGTHLRAALQPLMTKRSASKPAD